MPYLLRTRWRQLLVALALLLTTVSWALTMDSEFRSITYTFESPLTIAIWALCLVATLCLLISKYGALPRYMVFNPIMGMAVNLIFGSLVMGTNIPFYFDTIGTMVIAILYGPVLGMATGAGATVLSSSFAAFPLAFNPVAMLVGFLFGVLGSRNSFRYVAGTIAIGLVGGMLCGVVSVFPMIFSFGSSDGIGRPGLLLYFQMVTGDERLAIICQALLSHSVGKALTLLLACTIIRFAPNALRTYFVFPGNKSIVEHIFQESANNNGYNGLRNEASESSTGT
ncbi:hypothetical protein CBE89_08530 [Corynebacterium striatum]|uniref:ECF transporter S component n=1 Tax=Corynebacterium striatum TaxID=43770 RepID=A0A2Z2IZA2_CORST|nr:hypothetical protein CBE89_08530 [Corynebacterium striatum]